jgi:hypothetical protein
VFIFFVVFRWKKFKSPRKFKILILVSKTGFAAAKVMNQTLAEESSNFLVNNFRRARLFLLIFPRKRFRKNKFKKYIPFQQKTNEHQCPRTAQYVYSNN